MSAIIYLGSAGLVLQVVALLIPAVVFHAVALLFVHQCQHGFCAVPPAEQLTSIFPQLFIHSA